MNTWFTLFCVAQDRYLSQAYLAHLSGVKWKKFTMHKTITLFQALEVGVRRMGEERRELSPITETQLCLDLCAAQAVLWHIWKPSIVEGFSCGIQASMKAGDSGGSREEYDILIAFDHFIQFS